MARLHYLEKAKTFPCERSCAARIAQLVPHPGYRLTPERRAKRGWYIREEEIGSSYRERESAREAERQAILTSPRGLLETHYLEGKIELEEFKLAAQALREQGLW